MSKTTQTTKTTNNRKLKIGIITLLLIILCLLLFLWGKVNANTKLEREVTAEIGLLPGMNNQQIIERLNEVVEQSMLNISINPTPFFENGLAEGNIRIENIENNHYSFAVEIIRVDNNQTIMTTGIIDPGHYVENKKLDVNLPKGNYVCIANFTAYDTETLTYIGEAGAQIVVMVEN